MKYFILFLIFLFISSPSSARGNKNGEKNENGDRNFRGMNWADSRDNFVNGVLYLSGLSSSDTYASAAAVADKVISQMMSLTGSNSVRMPINEPTVANYWNTYTGAIDKALSKGKVILCYWAYRNGKPADMTGFWNMWSTVIGKYGSDTNCYFEPINEPYGYSDTALCNLYYSWIIRFSSVAQSRVILDGSATAQNVPAVGNDNRLSNCLLAVHDYSFFVSPPYTNETAWSQHIAGYVCNYSNRTICTEWGYPCSPGSKNGISFGYIDYSPGLTSNYFYYYARGIADQLNSWGMGSFYWPGLRDGDWYSMTQKNGSDTSIALSIPNASALKNLQRAWGVTTSVNIKLNNLPTHIKLGQNYPNPFNPSTTIEFENPRSEYVSMKVYDIFGRTIKTLINEVKERGTYKVLFDAADLTSGIYLCILKTGNFTSLRKMLFLK